MTVSPPYYACPIYPYAFHGTYTSYYALAGCDNGSPMSLDAANNTATDGCSNHWDGCSYVPGRSPSTAPAAPTHSNHPGTHKKLKKGIDDYPDGTVLVKDSKVKANYNIAPFNVDFDDSGTTRKATLMAIDATYGGVAMPTAYIGYEIDPSSASTGTAIVTDTDDHSYYVTYNGNTYNVILKK
jgi:hypothetical protein